MSERKAATLELLSDKTRGYKGILKTFAAVVNANHGHLADLNLAVLWRFGKSDDWWGDLKATTELVWQLTGIDLILQLNPTFWGQLNAAGRKGLLDHLCSRNGEKTGGKTEMEARTGEVRALFVRETPSLGIYPEVAARNPDFVSQVAELEALQKALAEPAQYLLDLKTSNVADLDEARAARAAADDEEDEEDETGEAEGPSGEEEAAAPN